MSAQKIGKCAFAQKKACFFEGSGCDDVAQKGCAQAEKIALAYSSECPAVLGGKCDIPRYRALLPDGFKCGDEKGCHVPREYIPAYDYENSGIIQMKTGPSPTPQEIKMLISSQQH